jgi:poly(A) polymerase
MRSNIEQNLIRWLEPMGNPPELFMVGGAVRDLLLFRPCEDIDLICRDAKEFAAKVAEKKGAALVPFEKKAGEPCYRVVDRGDFSFIDFSSVRGGSLNSDLACRDFTINAMAAEVRKGGKIGEIVDPLNGTGDLERKTIKTCGPGAFVNDPLRILRAVRFAAQLDFEIAPGTIHEMILHADKLTSVSSERIMAELFKIFGVERSVGFVRILDDTGVLEAIFPEIKPMKGCEQNGYHHLDVWNHCLLTVKNLEELVLDPEKRIGEFGKKVRENLDSDNRRPLLKIAALFHDAGKPSTRQFDESKKRATFHGHEQAGAAIVSDIAARMRMSRRDAGFLQAMTAEHLHVLNLTLPEVKTATRIRWFRKMKDDCVPAAVLAMADAMSKKGKLSEAETQKTKVERLRNLAAEYYSLGEQDVFDREPLIDGHDLIRMGASPGPAIGRVLERVRDARDEGSLSNREEALEFARKLIGRMK